MSASDYKPIPSSELPVEFKDLTVVPLEEVAKILEDGLKKNFHEVSVRVVDCPDLTEKPFDLASKGLCGQPRIVEVGGVPYLVPTVQMDKLYEMKDFPDLADFDFSDEKSALILGAGAAPWTYLERNAEMMANLSIGSGGKIISQRTQISKTIDEDGSSQLIGLPETETKMSLLANLFMSEGLPGKVLEVRAVRRTGDDNLVSCMRKTLEDGHPGHIGLGGVFCATKGRLKIHVMPKFSETPLNSNADVENWLNFYEMDAPFMNLSVFVSRDPGLDLRVEHTHGYNLDKGQGGHYHYDTTPEEVEYIGYFNLAEKCYRLDRPNVTHLIGRD